MSDKISQLGSGTAVTVTTTATLLDDTSASDSGGRFVLVAVPSDATATVYVGGAGVTAANGIPVAAGQSWSSGARLADTVSVYGIVSSGTQAVRVQESR